jgi:hypothetical protein
MKEESVTGPDGKAYTALAPPGSGLTFDMPDLSF